MKKNIFMSFLALTMLFPFVGKAEKINVAVSPLSPLCVLQENGEWTGFSIDLLNEVQKITGDEYVIVPTQNVKEKLETIQNGGAELAICGITYTSSRAEKMDAITVMETGIRAMTGTAPWWKSVLSANVLKIYLSLFVVMGIIGLIFWILEKWHHETTVKSFEDGIFLAATTISTVGYGQQTPVTRWGRVTAILAMLIGIPFFTAISGTIWQNIGSERGRVDFHKVEDLRNYKVGVVGDTSNQEFLERKAVRFHKYENAEKLYQAVIDGKIDIAVHDEVSVLNFVKNQEGEVIVAGPRMYRQNYAWFMPNRMKKKRNLQSALLRLMENGVIEQLHNEWIGD